MLAYKLKEARSKVYELEEENEQKKVRSEVLKDELEQERLYSAKLEFVIERIKSSLESSIKVSSNMINEYKEKIKDAHPLDYTGLHRMGLIDGLDMRINGCKDMIDNIERMYATAQK